MNGFKILFLNLCLISSACVKSTKESKNGSALFLMYKTAFTQAKEIAFWAVPSEYLPQALPEDKLFIENLSRDTIILQINRNAYIRDISYQNSGKDLFLDLVSIVKSSEVSVKGHLIFVRRNEASKLSLTIDNIPYLFTNLSPLK